MPDWDQVEVVKHGRKRDAAWYAETAEQRKKIEQYWEWHAEMERQYPVPPARSRTALYFSYLDRRHETFETDLFWPFCACGRQREPMRTSTIPPGLFGGPFTAKCPICDAKASVGVIAGMAEHIHPEWDDEDWLDSLQRTMPRAFEIGVLPDYWFELRGKHDHLHP